MLPSRADGLTPVVPLTTLRLAAIIVGDPAWNGAVQRMDTTPAGVLQWGWFYPPLPPGLPRWWWNTGIGKLELLELLEPLF